jgi:hypothetical protein
MHLKWGSMWVQHIEIDNINVLFIHVGITTTLDCHDNLKHLKSKKQGWANAYYNGPKMHQKSAFLHFFGVVITFLNEFADYKLSFCKNYVLYIFSKTL